MLSEEKIKMFLEDRNLTALAEKAGVSYPRLTYWIREGQKPQYDLLYAIGTYLEANAKEILEG